MSQQRGAAVEDKRRIRNVGSRRRRLRGGVVGDLDLSLFLFCFMIDGFLS